MLGTEDANLVGEQTRAIPESVTRLLSTSAEQSEGVVVPVGAVLEELAGIFGHAKEQVSNIRSDYESK